MKWPEAVQPIYRHACLYKTTISQRRLYPRGPTPKVKFSMTTDPLWTLTKLEEVLNCEEGVTTIYTYTYIYTIYVS